MSSYFLIFISCACGLDLLICGILILVWKMEQKIEHPLQIWDIPKSVIGMPQVSKAGCQGLPQNPKQEGRGLWVQNIQNMASLSYCTKQRSCKFGRHPLPTFGEPTWNSPFTVSPLRVTICYQYNASIIQHISQGFPATFDDQRLQTSTENMRNKNTCQHM